MDKGVLKMSEKERRHLEVLSRVKTAELTLKEAATLLKLSYRHIKRIYKRYQQEGDNGLIHRKRGKPSNRSYSPALKQEILSRYREFYSDFGPTLAAEKLVQAVYSIDHETLRRWLTVTGDWEKKKPKKAYRQRRQRRPHFGELVQLDGQVRMRFSKEYQASVQNGLKENPEIPGKEIYKRLLLAGYTGSYETSQRFVRQWKEVNQSE